MEPRQFVLAAEHLTLLRHAYIRWEDCEYGAPAIDCKRPYGNSSVELDIAEILGWEFDDLDGPTDQQRGNARLLHEETETALQVVLATGSFQPGVYQAPKYGSRWTLVEAHS